MKEKILKLHNDNKTSIEIAKILNCSVATVYYHLPGGKEKTLARNRKTNKNRQIKIKKMFGGKCNKCGYNRCLQALQFHHLPNEDKTGNVMGLVLYNWDKAVAEAKKCRLLCSNCHTEEHHLN